MSFPEIFGEYDIRGVFGSILDENMAYMLGKAIAVILNKAGHSEIILARDGRPSGDLLNSALINALISSAIDVVDLGYVTTPMAYFATHTPLLIDGCKKLISSCIVITGSHNPPEYNGFKIVINHQALYGESIKNIWELISYGKFLFGIGRLYSYDISQVYTAAIVDNVKITRTIDVVVDAGNGVAGIFAKKIFESIGCRVIPLFCEFDPSYPNHHPDPSCSKNLESLKTFLKSGSGELGLAFDGDGDRLGVVCQNGDVIDADRLLMLFSQDALSIKTGASIVFDIKCSGFLGEWIKKHSGNGVVSRSGHSLVKAKMRDCSALLAGEMSGHIFFADRWYGFDDGIYAGARLLELLSRKQNMTVLMQNIPLSCRSPEYKIDCDFNEKKKIMILIKKYAVFEGVKKRNELDGLRLDYDDGFGLIRASNTVPALVMYFEGKTEQALEKIKCIFKKSLSRILNKKKWPY